jgi:hypothetical protein
MSLVRNNLFARFLKFISKTPTVAFLLPIHGISIFLWWVAGSYLGFDVIASRSYWSTDDLCDPSTQGLGVHCWSDYYVLLIALESGNPYSPGEGSTLYPAAGLVPFMFFKWLTDTSGVLWLGLAAYLVLMSGLITYSVWAATNRQSFEQRVIVTSTLVLLSPAALVALDRGNSVGFLIPLLIWFFVSIRDNNSTHTVISLALLSVIKPHYGVLALAFLLVGRAKEGSRALGLGVTLNILPFLVFWPKEFPSNILIWANTLFGYQDYGSITGFWPQNISFSQSIYIVFYSLHVATGGQLQSILDFVESSQGLWGFLVLLLVLAIVLTFRKKLTLTHVSILVVSGITMTSAITYYYYTVVAIPFLLILDKKYKKTFDLDNEALKSQNQSYKNIKINTALWVSSIFTLVQFPILITQESEYTITTAPFIGGVWITCYLYILAVLVRSSYKSKTLQESKP